MLERMGEFFDRRLEGYETHQLECIAGAREFYPYTAGLLPMQPGAEVLDLGCGTGLELEAFFEMNPQARVTGIDLAQGMLERLRSKHSDKRLKLICGSYFTEEFGLNAFDAAVSVESLHHFTKEEKIPLYVKVYGALKKKGCFVLTDYFALTEEEEIFHRHELERLKKEQGIEDQEFYHYDTPLTVEHEMEALKAAGFASVKVLKTWGATTAIRAEK